MSSKRADNVPTKPKRRWLQFSLRTSFLVLLIAGIGFGFVASHAHKRQAALAVVRANGCTITFGPETDPNWNERILRRVFGAEIYQPVLQVNMLPKQFIERDKKKLPEDFLARLAALPEIEFLGLENTDISESDWRNISRFPKLQIVYVSHSNITDDAVKTLSQLIALEEISMNNAREITDVSINYVSKMPLLTNLKVCDTNITDQGLRALSQNSKNLRIIEIRGTNVTAEGVEQFRAVLPQCSVYGP